MVKVLVIGGNGFLGQHVVRSFLSEVWTSSSGGAELSLTVLDVREAVERVAGVEYVVGDMTSLESMDAALEGIDLVVHTASPVHGLGKAVYFKVNVEGTRTVVEACRTRGVKGLVYTSSAGVVFNGGDLVACDESEPYPEVPMDAYNDSKAVAEQLVLEANSATFATCALRPAGLFGEADAQLIPGMLGVLEKGQTRFQVGDNTNLFDFTYIGNAADAHVLAACKLLGLGSKDVASKGAVAGEAFFITNGTPIPFWNFPRALYAELNHVDKSYLVIPKSLAWYLAVGSELFAWLTGKGEASFTRFRVQFTCANRYYNIAKAQERLGYVPRVGMREGVRRSLEYLQQRDRLPKGYTLRSA
ncbi:erg26, C-3 sterol dehydrogenase [Savitreella phatthalungensis]